MTTTRRQFLHAAGAAAAATALPAQAAEVRIEAVAFDAFTLFDARSFDAGLAAHFPERAAALGAQWRARVFDYCWLRTITGSYADFAQIADDALTTTARGAKLEISAAARADILGALHHLKIWPDSAEALKTMKSAGLRLAPLSNFTEAMLRDNVKAAGIADLFDHLLSTDAARAYKPAPAAYHLAETAFRKPKASIAFAAFGGWDAAGARRYGFKTWWINRLEAPRDELPAAPDVEARTLAELAAQLAGK
jgi:2-haloacid dehalogenase